MTREEKINALKAIIQECEEYQWLRRAILFEVIKDLEQEPCEDCLSRKALYSALYERFHDEDANNITNVKLGTVRNFVKNFPSVTPQPKWIPVNERLPEAEYGESDSVLVCFENETQDVLYFDGNNWRYPTGETYISVNHKNDWHNKVVSWMPLPKSYSEVKE